jgi:hypothetical protein
MTTVGPTILRSHECRRIALDEGLVQTTIRHSSSATRLACIGPTTAWVDDARPKVNVWPAPPESFHRLARQVTCRAPPPGAKGRTMSAPMIPAAQTIPSCPGPVTITCDRIPPDLPTRIPKPLLPLLPEERPRLPRFQRGPLPAPPQAILRRLPNMMSLSGERALDRGGL